MKYERMYVIEKLVVKLGPLIGAALLLLLVFGVIVFGFGIAQQIHEAQNEQKKEVSHVARW